MTSKNVLYLASNLEDQETYNILSMELTRTDSNIYYVYAKGVLDSTWSRVCDAINRADGQMGVVLNRQQQYVWERGNRQESYQANLDEVPDVVLSGLLRKIPCAVSGRGLYGDEPYRMFSGQCAVSGQQGKSGNCKGI